MKYTLIFLIFFFIFLLIFYQIKVFTDTNFKPEPKEFTNNNLEPKELNLNNINLLEMKENNPILSCKNNNDIHFVEKENVNRKTILVLGFGLGGMPLELSLDNKTNQIDCIDINICMFKLYNTLIQNKPDKLHYYLSDAKEYLKNISKTYDIIIDDVFHYYKKEFYDFESRYNKLNNDGWLLINIHSMNDYEKYESLLKKLFRNIQIDTSRNICIFCQK